MGGGQLLEEPPLVNFGPHGVIDYEDDVDRAIFTGLFDDNFEIKLRFLRLICLRIVLIFLFHSHFTKDIYSIYSNPCLFTFKIFQTPCLFQPPVNRETNCRNPLVALMFNKKDAFLR